LLTLVLVESALEPIPEQLWKHPVVQKYARQRRKHPRHIVLDRSYHHSAMKTLELSEKRGRPDIVHFALLEALGSPLNREKLLQVYVHTLNDYVMTVNPETRLPRNCNRFVSLMEQLFELGRIPPDQTEALLLTLKRQDITQLMSEIKPSYILALSRIGKPLTLEATVSKLAPQEKPTVLVGGFPHGHFSKTTVKLADELICIDTEMLETWTVTSRVVYEFERSLSLPRKRLTSKEQMT
jgi:rRNA small subunit pseudouridine methyltransferase Nep1